MPDDGTYAIFRTDEVYAFVSKHPNSKGRLKTPNKLTGLLSEKLRYHCEGQDYFDGRTTRCYAMDGMRLDNDGLRVNAWTEEDLGLKKRSLRTRQNDPKVYSKASNHHCETQSIILWRKDDPRKDSVIKS